jgi:beta-N-acetylhexosaminidase
MRPVDQAVSQVAQMFCFGFEGQAPTPFIREFLGRGGGGGYILFRRNFDSAEGLRALNEELRGLARGLPAFAMVDQEGGPVLRLGDLGSPVPAMAVVGAQEHPRRAREVGRLLGREVRAVGFNVDCAPVIDVHSNPANPIIGQRAFSSDPDRVGDFAAALAHGLHEVGVLAVGKHFPGHGDTAVDSHLDLPRVPHDRERLERVELRAFRRALAAEPFGLLMTAHVVYEGVDPAWPATLSPTFLQGILRDDLRYGGVVVTDDLEMGALRDRYDIREVVRQGLVAGVDLFLVCRSEDTARAALSEAERLVRDGEVSPVRVSQSIRRIARAKGPLRGQAVPSEQEMRATLRSAEHMALLDRLRTAPDPGAPG